MKKCIAFFFICICGIALLYGQSERSGLTAVQLIKPREIYLNGGTRASLGGKSRIYIQIDLPLNTVKWFYSFSTSKGESGTKLLNLLAQVTANSVDPAKLASGILNIEVPEGSSSIDVYLCDRPNLDRFINRYEYRFLMEGTVENTRQGVVEIDDVNQGTWYLGLKNPSSLDGVNITLEVVALVSGMHVTGGSDMIRKAELYGNLGWKQFEKGEYQKCIEFSDKSLEHYKYGWVYANKGLAQLMLGLEQEAMESYIEAISLIHKQDLPQLIFAAAISDVRKALRINPGLSGANDIKELLQMEMIKAQ